jgi:hypothetical protein
VAAVALMGDNHIIIIILIILVCHTEELWRKRHPAAEEFS